MIQPLTEEDLTLSEESPVLPSDNGSLEDLEQERPASRGSTRSGVARHFTENRRRRSSTARRGRPPASDKIGQIKNGVQETIALIGMGIQVGMPLTGLVIVNRSDQMGNELALLAERNPAVRRILERLILVGGFASLGFVAKDVAIAVAVERGMFPMDHPLASGIQEEIQIMVQVHAKAAALAQAQAQQGVPQQEAPAA